jgi:glycosyltransferase involved in cell wall biosynthesis
LKIIFILPEYYPHSGGGMCTYYLHYIRAIRPYCEKIKVIVGSGYDQRDENYSLDGVEIEYLQTSLYYKYLSQFEKFDLLPEFKRNLAAAWAMYEQANEGDGFDVIECTDFGLGFVPWVIRHHKPVITRLHGSRGQIALNENERPDGIIGDFTRQTELLLLPLCDSLITYSKANRDYWNELFGNEKVIKIDPVFNTWADEPLPLPQRDRYGLVTARVQQWKGPVQLCEALAELGPEEAPLVKWIGRDMPYNGQESTAVYLTRNFPRIWNSRLQHQAALPNEQIKLLQQNARIGIVPSTWDMFNFTCLEFLSAGTVVICADGAGCSDLITSGLNGFIYGSLDPSGLAECLRLVNRLDEEAYQEIALAGLAMIRERLSPERLVPQNISQYESVISNFKSRSSNQFFETAYVPSGRPFPIGEVLDTLPLKQLLGYITKRLKAKIKF